MDDTGRTFGFWTVIEAAQGGKYRCRCQCGNVRDVNAYSIKAGKSISCGCKRSEKAKRTWLEKYGVANPSQVAEIKEKKKETLLKNYGVDSPLKSQTVMQKMKDGLVAKYGVDHNMHIPGVREKAKKTSVERFGVEYACQSEVVKERQRATMLERYGVEYSMQNPASKEKCKKTLMERYRVYNPSLLKDDLIVLSNGMTLSSYAEQHGVRSSWPYVLYRRFGEQKAIDFILNYRKKITHLENSFINLMSEVEKVEHYNKAPDGVEGLERKKPDFRIPLKSGGYLYVNVDGLYWHSEKEKPKDYHFRLREEFAGRGLKLLQFYEDEIYNKPEIVRSIVCNAAGKLPNKFFAREGQIKPVGREEADSFLEQNHIMGKSGFSKAAGLYDEDRLLAVMTVRVRGEELEIVRFCSRLDASVVGGLSRLLSFFVKETNPKSVFSFVDLRYGDGNSLSKIGFALRGITRGWTWTDGYKRYNRLRCRANMDERGLSQREHAEELGWYKIYDAGQACFVKELR